MMKRIFAAVIGIVAVSATSLLAQDFAPGEIVPEVQCQARSSYSYLLYLPSGYDPQRIKGYPVLFVMGAGGGNPGGLKRYVRGAEKNKWILAMSTQSSNSFSKSDKAIDAMVADVFGRLHVNKRRCYSSGMSGGAREAFLLAARMKSNIIGIIPCGAGDASASTRTRALAYGLCGGSCFNRWDMAVGFGKRSRRTARLRFFEGGHVWAGEDLIFDAITWLNARYLGTKGTTPEINAFSAMLIDEIEGKLESDPYFAYENALVLSELMRAPDSSKAKRIVTDLKADPKVKLYIEGLVDMDRFVRKHFDTDVMDYINNPCTPQQKRAAEKLLEKYSDTPLAGAIQGFAKPSKKFNK